MSWETVSGALVIYPDNRAGPWDNTAGTLWQGHQFEGDQPTVIENMLESLYLDPGSSQIRDLLDAWVSAGNFIKIYPSIPREAGFAP